MSEHYGGSVDGAWRAITWSRYERQILIADREINYVDIGAGDPVVLLHGHGSTWQYWLDVIALLSDRRRVVALDLPGFGSSLAHPWRAVSMAGIVSAIGELLDRLDVAECDLVGHSMGSIFALEVAAADPNRIRTLTLAGGPALSIVAMFQHPLRTALRHPRLALTVVSDMITAGLPIPQFVQRWVAHHRWLRKLAFGTYVARPELLAPDLCTQLMKGVGAPAYFHIPLKARRYRPAPFESVRCPVMLVNGRDDAFVPTHDVAAFTARMPQTRSHIIDDAGHLVTVEYPTAYTHLFIDFTDRGNPRPAEPG
ncbi:MAG: alpha/beta fold hydrolase, partial [Mycobacterium sp.]